MRFEPLASLRYRVTGAQLRRKQDGSVLGQLARRVRGLFQRVPDHASGCPKRQPAPRPIQSAALGPR